MAVSSFRDLRVWQLGVTLAERVYAVTRAFPRSETYGLASQMQRAAVSVPSNIAEGHARQHLKEYLHHLSIALGSLAELETQFEIAVRLDYLSREACDAELANIGSLGRQLSALINALNASKWRLDDAGIMQGRIGSDLERCRPLRPLTIPPLDAATGAELRRRYDATADPEDRSRYQMVWLAHAGQPAPGSAQLVLRSPAPVRRVLHRFRAGGLAAVPRRTAPGPEYTVTPAWEAELLRSIDADPHAVGVQSANWTTGRLAAYLAERTGVAVSDETVRQYLLAHDYVCKRPTWTLQRRAGEQDGYVGNA